MIWWLKQCPRRISAHPPIAVKNRLRQCSAPVKKHKASFCWIARGWLYFHIFIFESTVPLSADIHFAISLSNGKTFRSGNSFEPTIFIRPLIKKCYSTDICWWRRPSSQKHCFIFIFFHVPHKALRNIPCLDLMWWLLCSVQVCYS